MTYTCRAWEFSANTSAEIAAPAKQIFPHHWKISKAHTCSAVIVA
jgi:hypothetical protein